MTRLVLQPGGDPAPPSGQRVREAVEARFDEAQRERVPFACFFVQIDGLELLRKLEGEAPAREVLTALVTAFARAPELDDALGHSVEDHLLLATRVARHEDVPALAEAMRSVAAACPVDGRPRRLRLSIGVATNAVGALAHAPQLLLDTLIEVAAEGASVAAASGGDRAVHSELYELHQRRFEREAPERVAAQRTRVSAPAAAVASVLEGAVRPSPTRPLPRDPHPGPPELTVVPPAPPDDERAALLRRIRDALDTAGEGPGARRRAEQAIAEVLLAEERRRRRDDDLLAEVDRLERRIAKLRRALESVEVARGEEGLEGPDPSESWGLAGRSEGGLSPGDPGYERKQALMAAIFEANRDLRRAMSERSA